MPQDGPRVKLFVSPTMYVCLDHEDNLWIGPKDDLALQTVKSKTKSGDNMIAHFETEKGYVFTYVRGLNHNSTLRLALQIFHVSDPFSSCVHDGKIFVMSY